MIYVWKYFKHEFSALANKLWSKCLWKSGSFIFYIHVPEMCSDNCLSIIKVLSRICEDSYKQRHIAFYCIQKVIKFRGCVFKKRLNLEVLYLRSD